ncbi:MAG: amino acid adenylation domain-containing protein [Tildeniella torsiva UHER 1998/13D]|jgi:amino acid adenylation domain-containing protein|nr:amino acid adenylation domain-containing protein [Tildeniella torsiva UHER 1998/13D]
MTERSQSWPQLARGGCTWVELLSQRSQAQPDQIAFTFLQDGEVESARWSYRDLDQRSRAIAAQLQALGLAGQRALLLYPAGLDYVAAFFGCLYAGVIAVPAYPPQNARKTPRIQAIAQDAEAAIALTTVATLPRLQTLMEHNFQTQSFQWLATDTLDPALADSWQMPDISGDTLPFLQYTSGSTGNPRGVMLSHRNLLHNAMATYQMMGHSASSCFVSWLPLYHDMGLIGGILQPLYGGFRCVLMSPVSFLQRPYRWLKAISDYRATTSGAPNFAYDLCVEKISPEQRQTLDLSSWQVAFNGAEPIRAQTLERFTTAFSPWGFRPEAHYPCYGLAEGSLMVSGSTVAQSPMVQAFQAADLDRGWVTPVQMQARAQALVSCGQSLPDQQIAIVQPETLTRCAEAEVGEIWVSSPSVGQGYWQNPQATADTFQAYLKDSGAGPFLRTGDLGFLHQGELFVTGRLKDLIILRGRNLYPQDLEHTAETSHSALRSGGCAAFTVPVEDAERLVIVQELEFRQQPDLDGAIAAIRQAIAATHEVEVYAVALIKPGSIAKTTSGKIQRRACRQAYLTDQLSLVKCSVLAAPMAIAVPVSPPAPLSAECLRQAPSQDRSSLLAAHLQQAIAQTLQCAPEQVQPHIPLTQLGLDSLRVMALKGQIETDWGVEIAIADFFEDITPDQMAQRILDQVSRQSPEVERASLAPAQPTAQLTPSQTQIFFLQQLQPQSPAYNVAIALDFKGSLNIEALRQSLQILVERHSALRSQVVLQAGQPTLATAPTIELPWLEVDLRAWESDRREAEMQQLTQAIARQPFDLCQSPLFRLLLCQLEPRHQRLVTVVHHLIFDGRSANIFFQELTAQYHACLAGLTKPCFPEPSSKPPLHLLASQPWQHQLDYWQQQLSGELPILQLPIDYPRPALQTFQGARAPFIIDSALVAPLKVLAQQEKATLFMVLLAAFKAWLYRYTGQRDLLVGSALAQPQPEQPQAIGCSINTLALRTQPDGSMPFREFLHQVRQMALAAYSHGAVPFQTLVETLQPQRDPSYSPLVQVMFDLQPLPTRLDWPYLTVELAELETGTAKFDLTLSLIETEQGIQGHWEYNTALFAPATLHRMMAHFQQLLVGIVANPDQSLAALPLLSEAERRQMLWDWNQTAAPIPNRPFQQLFEDQVERTPAAIALRYAEQQLTYRDLNQRANQLAHYLQTLGLGSEQLVGVCLPRSPELLVSLLAILKAGGAYVPIDPSYPLERLAFMVQDSQIQVLITQSDLGLGLATDWQPQVIELDTQTAAIAQRPITNLGHTATLDQLAYVIYTSGSTGKPKGVMIEQRGLVNYLTWCQQAYPLAAGQGAPVQSSISFDMTITSLFSPLLAGQTVELLPEDWGLDALATGLRRRPNFSLVKITPAQLELLSHQLTAAEFSGRTHAFIIGGENLSAEQVNSWLDRAPETRLVNEYGPTETVVGCCVHTVTPQEPRSGSIPIGRPIINTQLYILDYQHQPVPIGVVGELYIGGAGVARGYWNRPDLTAERFIANPFADGLEAPDRLYKTGDLTRYRPDGVIEYLGRIDHQVKIRGYRVELGEIEAVLTQHAAVRDAVVVVTHADGPDQLRLVAYVVGTRAAPTAAGPPEQSAWLQPIELRHWLRQRLPDYMVPGAFVVLDRLPLTVNGKVDRLALPAPSLDRPELGHGYIAPQAELERAIAEIWQSVLKLDRVGLHDNFFDLGGHSLLLVQVQSQLQTQLNRTVSLVDLFRHPTVHAIAAYLERPSESLVTTAQTQASRQKAALQRRRLQMQQGGHHD